MKIKGTVTADATVATVETTNSNKQVVNFSIAINEGYRPEGDHYVQQTTFIDCAYWRNAQTAKLIKKGMVVEFEGRLGSRPWSDRDGVLRSSVTCNVTDFIAIGNAQISVPQNGYSFSLQR